MDAVYHSLTVNQDFQFEYWFKDNDVRLDRLRLTEPVSIKLNRIITSFINGDTIETFYNLINYVDPRDVGDWYQEVGNDSIVPFQMNKLHPSYYPKFCEALHNYAKGSKKVHMAELLQLYDEEDDRDRFMLIWCLKSMVKVSYPKKLNSEVGKKTMWVLDESQVSKEYFAPALFYGYLAVKGNRHEFLKLITSAKAKYNLSTYYYVHLGVFTKTRPARLVKQLPHDMLNEVQECYETRNEEKLKEVLKFE